MKSELRIELYPHYRICIENHSRPKQISVHHSRVSSPSTKYCNKRARVEHTLQFFGSPAAALFMSASDAGWLISAGLAVHCARLTGLNRSLAPPRCSLAVLFGGRPGGRFLLLFGLAKREIQDPVGKEY